MLTGVLQVCLTDILLQCLAHLEYALNNTIAIGV